MLYVYGITYTILYTGHIQMEPKVNTFYYIPHKIGPNGEIEING